LTAQKQDQTLNITPKLIHTELYVGYLGLTQKDWKP